MNDKVIEAAQEATGTMSKVTPAAVGGGVSAFSFFGCPLPDIVQLLTFVYVLFSLVKLVWDWFKEAEERAEKRRHDKKNGGLP